MKARIRGTLFVGCLAAVLLAAFASGAWLEHAQRLPPLTTAEGRAFLLIALGVSAGVALLISRILRSASPHPAHEHDVLEAVLQEMLAGIIVLESDQRIVLCNSAARSLLNLRDEVDGLPLADVLRVPATQELLADARSGRASKLEFELPGTPPRVVQARGTPQLSSGRTILVLLDVTEARMLERVRRDFVTNVSHELRTPVTVIRTNAETLLDGAMEDPVASTRFLEGIHRHGERLSALIADLLDLSRIEAGQREINLEDLDLSELLSRTIEGLAPLAEKRQTRIAWACPGGLRVAADREAIDQILGNLTENAIKYSGEGRSVELRARRGPAGVPRPNSTVLIEVWDNGPGIPSEHHARLFVRFYRVDRGRSREAGGTGLGLSIVRHLAESMGGLCGYRANVPRGSIFWIELAEGNEAPT